MRSLIILEVEHEDETILDEIAQTSMIGWYPYVTDYAIKSDIPECFRLDK